MKKKILLQLALLLFSINAFAQQAGTAGVSGVDGDEKKPLRIYENRGGNFELRGPDRKDVSLEDFRGKVVLIYFGYTYCPDVCPMSLTHLKMGMLELEEQAKNVQVLFVTIDPERDTPEKLKEYVPYFYPTFIGLTGSVNDVTEVARQYGARFFKQYVESVEGYFMAHTDAVFLVDQKGRLRGRYKTEFDMQKLIADIHRLLSNY